MKVVKTVWWILKEIWGSTRHVKIETQEKIEMTKKPSIDSLDFSDISATVPVVAPVVVETKPERIREGWWLGGVPLEDCTPEEVKEWASNLVPHKSISGAPVHFLKNLQSKKLYVDKVVTIFEESAYMFLTPPKPNKYHN